MEGTSGGFWNGGNKDARHTWKDMRLKGRRVTGCVTAAFGLQKNNARLSDPMYETEKYMRR